MWPDLYRTLTAAAAPLVAEFIEARCRRGKEDRARLRERFGFPSMVRPAAPLLWIHAASVGEANSVLALIDRVLAERPLLELLMTTGTVAAARLMEERLPPRARHQYVPVDVPRAVERFLDHWHPDMAIWVESELWPNLILAARRRGIPACLVNARLSARSMARWRMMSGLVRPVLGAFSLCLAQDATQAARFRELGARPVACVGDLKGAAPPLAADAVELTALTRAIANRPVWLAASTHPGEEEAVAAAHRQLAATHRGLLTIIAPRHPVRAETIYAMLKGNGLQVVRRTSGDPITPDTDIYLADTMGEMGLFFRAVGIAFIGGSLARKGGHNPFEAARLDCAILHGPDMSNCAAMAEALAEPQATRRVNDAASLAAAVSQLFDDPGERSRRAAAAARVAVAHSGSLDAVLRHLSPWLDSVAPAASLAANLTEHPRMRAVAGDARA